MLTRFLICLFKPNYLFTLNKGISFLFGLSTIYLLKASTDYFSQSTALNIITHTCSLGVEEQSYFLLPFLIWFIGFGHQTSKGVMNLLLSVLFLVIFSLIIFIYLNSINQPAVYFSMSKRFWEMATGCLLFLEIDKKIFLKLYIYLKFFI